MVAGTSARWENSEKMGINAFIRAFEIMTRPFHDGFVEDAGGVRVWGLDPGLPRTQRSPAANVPLKFIDVTSYRIQFIYYR